MYPEGWVEENNFLTKTFEKKDFIDVVEFLNRIVPLAEEVNHHPDVEIFSYKKIKIKLSTHDVGNITEKDIELAKRIDAIA